MTFLIIKKRTPSVFAEVLNKEGMASGPFLMDQNKIGSVIAHPPPENGAGEFSGRKPSQHLPEKTGPRVVEFSKVSDSRAPALLFTCVHPTLVPLGGGGAVPTGSQLWIHLRFPASGTCFSKTTWSRRRLANQVLSFPVNCNAF